MLLNFVDHNSHVIFTTLVALLAGTFTGGTGPIVKATLQNVTLPQWRGQAFALFNTFDDFGRGLGPVFLAQLIVHFGGRTRAFNIGVLGWILCGIMNLAMFWTVRHDEQRVAQTLSMNFVSSSSVGGDGDDDDGDGRGWIV
jgi:MFS-type transporter involved in bile tolerance (Atg22 family)